MRTPTADRQLLLEVRKELARRSFWQYCKLKAPDAYKDSRPHLRRMCDELEAFLASDDNVFVLNLPPRHYKSRTAVNLVEWVFGSDQGIKVMTGSYNSVLSKTFAKSVRNTIKERKGQSDRLVYSDIFPGVSIKPGDGSMNLWSLVGGYNNYLATSPDGTATGFGADLFIIDDLIKNAAEAHNARVLEEHWNWFVNTMLSRLETGGKIIIIMTRWHSEDLAGRAIEELPGMGYKVRQLSLKALQDDGTMLCDEILTREEYDRKVLAMSDEIASANYQQEPIDIKGRLYSSFKTYDELPCDADGRPLFEVVKNYTDSADEGDNFLCSINYGVREGEAYVTDVLYTDAPMEETEPATAKMLYEGGVNVADIESNNGGRGFARAVERTLWEVYRSKHTVVQTFFQNKNKQARILSNATWVMQHVHFPADWREQWPEFYRAMTRYQRKGKNDYDDGPDCVTGIAEKIEQGNRFSFD